MPLQEGGVAGAGGDSAVELVVGVLVSEQGNVTIQNLPMEGNHAGGKVKSTNCVTFTGYQDFVIMFV